MSARERVDCISLHVHNFAFAHVRDDNSDHPHWVSILWGFLPTLWGSRGFSLSESWGRNHGRRETGGDAEAVPRRPWFRPQLSESEKPLEPRLLSSIAFTAIWSRPYSTALAPVFPPHRLRMVQWNSSMRACLYDSFAMLWFFRLSLSERISAQLLSHEANLNTGWVDHILILLFCSFSATARLKTPASFSCFHHSSRFSPPMPFPNQLNLNRCSIANFTRNVSRATVPQCKMISRNSPCKFSIANALLPISRKSD